MDRQQIENELIAIVAKTVKKSEDAINMQTKFKEDLNIKSVLGMKICALINMKFGIKISVPELLNSVSLNDVAELIEKTVKGL